MPNAIAHRVGAALVIGGVSVYQESQSGQVTGNSLAAAGLAAACGTLPDILEPATHPNHRQFFHSFGFAVLVGGGLYQLYKWQPESGFGRFVRSAGLVAGGAYAVHLAMDTMTSKSLPLLGRI